MRVAADGLEPVHFVEHFDGGETAKVWLPLSSFNENWWPNTRLILRPGRTD